MRNIVGRFAATGNDGHAYSVEVIQTYITGGAAGATVPSGSKKLFTSNGMRVTRLKQGRYRVDQTGVTLTSTAPTAL